MTSKEVEENKNILRQFLNGHGIEVQNSITTVLALLDKQKPLKVISIEGVSSQTCPICQTNVNWNFCPNCGQRISYA